VCPLVALLICCLFAVSSRTQENETTQTFEESNEAEKIHKRNQAPREGRAKGSMNQLQSKKGSRVVPTRGTFHNITITRSIGVKNAGSDGMELKRILGAALWLVSAFYAFHGSLLTERRGRAGLVKRPRYSVSSTRLAERIE
jgi:hypothetical protein